MARVTIEDCSLAAMKRAKSIYNGTKSLSDEKNKPVVLALREIAEEKVIAVKKPSK